LRFRSRESQPSRGLRTAEPIKALESASGRRGSVRTPTRSGSNPDRGASPRQNRLCARSVPSNRWNRWGIQLFFTNPLVALQEEFNSSALAQVNRPGMDVAQRGRGGEPLGPPHSGTGRPFCSWCNLGQSAELSNIDIPGWRNGESLRVRHLHAKSGSILTGRDGKATRMQWSRAVISGEADQRPRNLVLLFHQDESSACSQERILDRVLNDRLATVAPFQTPPTPLRLAPIWRGRRLYCRGRLGRSD